jgi:serine/threonine protein kinase
MLLETAPRSCIPRPIASQPRVLRAYDNRLVYTNRRQDVYLKFFKDTTEVVVEYEDRALATVNHDKPAPETLPFGTFQKGSTDRDWLWSFRGRFSVLSVPYHLGRHWTHEISEFIPVLEQLRSLHRKGLVHGDIRCSNIVFAGANGQLIDFDLGGNVADQNPPRFPANYVFKHEDGTRWARPKAAISAMDDVYAMTQVVLECHDIQPPPFDFGESKPSEHLTEGTSLPPKNLKIEDEIAELLKQKKLYQEREKLRQDWEHLLLGREMLQMLAVQEDEDLTEGTSLPPKKLKLVDDLAEPQKAVEVGQAKERLLTSDLSVDEAAERRLSDLVAFLKKVQSQNWTVRPDPAMLYTMKRWGFNVSNEEGGGKDSLQEAEHATGSPEAGVKK